MLIHNSRHISYHIKIGFEIIGDTPNFLLWYTTNKMLLYYVSSAANISVHTDNNNVALQMTYFW